MDPSHRLYKLYHSNVSADRNSAQHFSDLPSPSLGLYYPQWYPVQSSAAARNVWCVVRVVNEWLSLPVAFLSAHSSLPILIWLLTSTRKVFLRTAAHRIGQRSSSPCLHASMHLPCDWLIRYLCKQVVKQAYLWVYPALSIKHDRFCAVVQNDLKCAGNTRMCCTRARFTFVFMNGVTQVQQQMCHRTEDGHISSSLTQHKTGQQCCVCAGVTLSQPESLSTHSTHKLWQKETKTHTASFRLLKIIQNHTNNECFQYSTDPI